MSGITHFVYPSEVCFSLYKKRVSGQSIVNLCFSSKHTTLKKSKKDLHYSQKSLYLYHTRKMILPLTRLKWIQELITSTTQTENKFEVLYCIMLNEYETHWKQQKKRFEKNMHITIMKTTSKQLVVINKKFLYSYFLKCPTKKNFKTNGFIFVWIKTESSWKIKLIFTTKNPLLQSQKDE